MGGKVSFWKSLYRYKVHHVAIWLGYFAFWISFYRPYYDSLPKLIFITSIYFFFNAVAFYVTSYILIPRQLFKGRYFLFFASFGLFMAALSCGLAGSLYVIFKDADPSFDGKIIQLLQMSFMAITFMVGFMSGTKLVVDRIRNDRQARILDQQRLESELQFLKSQVNPHFLFNAINSVYILIKKDPDKAAETLIKLSDLLRFQLYDCSEERIPIEKEIDYIQNFISLEKIRKGQKVKVHYHANGNLRNFVIAPFMLIPFIENAFKHVSSHASGENEITIDLDYDAGKFVASVVNTTDRNNHYDVGGIGLKNVRRRLELLYPGRHELSIAEQEDRYAVNLSLNIT